MEFILGQIKLVFAISQQSVILDSDTDYQNLISFFRAFSKATNSNDSKEFFLWLKLIE